MGHFDSFGFHYWRYSGFYVALIFPNKDASHNDISLPFPTYHDLWTSDVRVIENKTIASFAQSQIYLRIYLLISVLNQF